MNSEISNKFGKLPLGQEWGRNFTEEKLRRRWREVSPRARVQQISGGQVMTEGEHRSLVLQLLLAGLSMRDIRRTGLDLPGITNPERLERLEEYERFCERRRAGRPGAPASLSSGLSLLQD